MGMYAYASYNIEVSEFDLFIKQNIVHEFTGEDTLMA
jgi:hypothetical protein